MRMLLLRRQHRLCDPLRLWRGPTRRRTRSRSRNPAARRCRLLHGHDSKRSWAAAPANEKTLRFVRGVQCVRGPKRTYETIRGCDSALRLAKTTTSPTTLHLP